MQKRLKLKGFRAGKGLNQTQMAKMCGVSRAIYSLIELGKQQGTADFWLNLKTEFNLSPAEVWEMQYEGK